MSRTTTTHRISWTSHTLNPGIFGCSVAGPECRSCYAAVLAHRKLGPYGQYRDARALTRLGRHGVRWTGKVYTDYDRIGPAFAALPKRKPGLVFLTSMADIGHRLVPRRFLAAVLAEVAARPHLTFLALTKRPHLVSAAFGTSAFIERVRREFGERAPGRAWPGWPLPNYWPGTTAGDGAAERRERLEALARTPAASVRFVSVEPMLGRPALEGLVEPTQIERAASALRVGRHPASDEIRHRLGSPINWVIFGGESKTTRRAARALDLDELRSSIAFLEEFAPGVGIQVKQLGSVWADNHRSSSRTGGNPVYWPADLRPYFGLPPQIAKAAGLGELP